jgi:hypothetical protein
MINMVTMKKPTIDQALESLGETLKSLSEVKTPEIDYLKLAQNIPSRSLSGDHIHGGTVRNFSSVGIKDSATNKVLTVSDNGIEVQQAKISKILDSVEVENRFVADSAVIKNDLTVSGVLRANIDVNWVDFIKKIPNRALSGDLINGGTIRNFASAGIKDVATSNKILIKDEAVFIDTMEVKNFRGSVQVEKTLKTAELEVEGLLKAGKIEVRELKADLRLERTTPLEFKTSAENPVYGKGMIWSGTGSTKQFILHEPDILFSTENINLNSGKSYMIDKIKVLDIKELGSSIVKSNLKEVGTLKNLSVSGDVVFNSHIFYNHVSGRLSIGTEEPNSNFSIVENNVELQLGIKEGKRIILGSYGYHDVDIISDNTTRMTVGADGNIVLGNKNSPPTTVHIHGKIGVGVNQIDPNVDLQVKGSIKFNNKTHAHGEQAPEQGSYNVADIVWNLEPRTGRPVGWVCVRGGTPGDWKPFGIVG